MKSRAFALSGRRTMGRCLSLVLVTLGFCHACQEPSTVPYERPLDPTHGESYTLGVVLLSEFSGRVEPRHVINAAVCRSSNDFIWPRATCKKKCDVGICEADCIEACEMECLKTCTEEDCDQFCKTNCEQKDCKSECEVCEEEICERNSNSARLKLGEEFASWDAIKNEITIYPYGQEHGQEHLSHIICSIPDPTIKPSPCLEYEKHYICNTAQGGSVPLDALWKIYFSDEVRRIRASNGDSVGRTSAMSGFFSDIPTVQNLNAIGLNYDTIGNHNFDKHLDYLQNVINAASFRFVSATLENVPQNLTNIAPYAIFSVPADGDNGNALHVAVIGAVDDTTMAVVYSGKFGSLTISNHCAVKLALQDAYHKNVRAFIIAAHFNWRSTRALLVSLFGLIDPDFERKIVDDEEEQELLNNSLIPCRGLNLPIPEDHLILHYYNENNTRLDSVSQLTSEEIHELVNAVNAKINREIFEGIIAVFGEASDTSLLQAFVIDENDVLPSIDDNDTFRAKTHNFLLYNTDADDNGSWLDALRIVQPNAERFVGKVDISSIKAPKCTKIWNAERNRNEFICTGDPIKSDVPLKDVLWFIQVPGYSTFASSFSFVIHKTNDIKGDKVSNAYHAMLSGYHITSAVTGYTPKTPKQCEDRMMDHMPACKDYYHAAVSYIKVNQKDREAREAILEVLNVDECTKEIADAISSDQIQTEDVFDYWYCIYRASSHLICGEEDGLKPDFYPTEVFTFPQITQTGNQTNIYFPETDNDLRYGSSFVTGLFGDIYYAFSKILKDEGHLRENVDIILMNAGMYGTGIYYRVLESLRMQEYMPYENNLVVFDMTPRRFADYFEHGLAQRPRSGAFPALSGIHISYMKSDAYKKPKACADKKPERDKRVYEMFKVGVNGNNPEPIYVFLGTHDKPIDYSSLELKGCSIDNLNSCKEKTIHIFRNKDMLLEFLEEEGVREYYLTKPSEGNPTRPKEFRIMTNNFIADIGDGYIDASEKGNCNRLIVDPVIKESKILTTYTAVTQYLYADTKTCKTINSDTKAKDGNDKQCLLARSIVKRHYEDELISDILKKNENKYPLCIVTIDGDEGFCRKAEELCQKATTN
ncbi:MAG: hypothetical protein FWC40_01190 [Proteobacteria bacterium]|nr:hypothetical protein [Pseudomonadota bacterium]